MGDCLGQLVQHQALRVRELAHLAVNDAQRSHALAAWHDQRHARIKADIGRTCDQGVGSKARVRLGVTDFHQRIALDGVRAKRDFLVSLYKLVQANIGFEPLAFAVKQADQCNRCIANDAGQTRQRLKNGFWLGVQNSQHTQPFSPPGLIAHGTFDTHA